MRIARRNRLEKARPIMGTRLMLDPCYVCGLLVFFLLAISILAFAVVDAKEIEATHEWQLLGANDTVAAGMHIRMDVTTGEKWVKLPDPDDENDFAKQRRNSNDNDNNKGSSSGLAVVSTNGESQVVKDDTGSTKRDDYDYDYDMIHRTLSQLPDEDKERMRLPELPAETSSVASLSPEARAHFEARLKRIWEDRQAELRRIEQEWVADLPQLLKDRIASLRAYLADPVNALRELSETTQEERTDSDPDSYVITNILDVLKDLEYQLSDVDMTRDFYTMGGWPLLAALLSDAVHSAGPTTTAANKTATDSISLQDNIHLIQMHAAWALGTAVKNTGEFLPYVLEPIAIVDLTTSTSNKDNDAAAAAATTVTTVLDLASQQFRSTLLLPASSAGAAAASSSLLASEADRQKLSKIVYCLGSFLRGNRPAQVHFVQHEGPAAILAALQTALVRLEKDEALSSTQSPFYRKLTQRLLQLASDTVLDVTLHGVVDDDNNDQLIVAAYTSAEWCEAVHSALLLSDNDSTKALLLPIHNTLPTVHTLAPYCRPHWDNKEKRVFETLEEFQRHWSKKRVGDDESVDGDVRQENLELVETTLQRLREA